jgi:hypothetical protein
MCNHYQLEILLFPSVFDQTVSNTTHQPIHFYPCFTDLLFEINAEETIVNENVY